MYVYYCTNSVESFVCGGFEKSRFLKARVGWGGNGEREREREREREYKNTKPGFPPGYRCTLRRFFRGIVKKNSSRDRGVREIQ